MPVTAKAPMRVAPATLCMHVKDMLCYTCMHKVAGAKRVFCNLHSIAANLTKRRLGHIVREDAVDMDMRVKTKRNAQSCVRSFLYC